MLNLPKDTYVVDIEFNTEDSKGIVVFATKAQADKIKSDYIAQPYGVLEITGLLASLILKSENILNISVNTIDQYILDRFITNNMNNDFNYVKGRNLEGILMEAFPERYDDFTLDKYSELGGAGREPVTGFATDPPA